MRKTKQTTMRLPLELLDKIFALASADGGKSTCALRAASQTFRAMNEAYYLDTVFVTSVDSIWALCDTLRSIPSSSGASGLSTFA
jgi:predicted DNA-binding protein